MQSPFASTIAFYTANCTYSPAPRTPAISRHLTIPHSPSVTPRKKPAYTADPAKKRMQVRFFGHLMPQNGSIEKRRGTPWHSKSGLFQSLTTNRARSVPNPEAGRAPAVRGAGLFPGKAQDAGLLQRSVRSAAGGPGVRGRQAGGKAGTRRGGQLQFQDQTLRLPAGDRRGGARARLLLPQSGALRLPQEHHRKP